MPIINEESKDQLPSLVLMEIKSNSSEVDSNEKERDNSEDETLNCE
jgi:hypothetical protein